MRLGPVATFIVGAAALYHLAQLGRIIVAALIQTG